MKRKIAETIKNFAKSFKNSPGYGEYSLMNP